MVPERFRVRAMESYFERTDPDGVQLRFDVDEEGVHTTIAGGDSFVLTGHALDLLTEFLNENLAPRA